MLHTRFAPVVYKVVKFIPCFFPEANFGALMCELVMESVASWDAVPYWFSEGGEIGDEVKGLDDLKLISDIDGNEDRS